MNLSKNAIGNLINRYKAVLKKCHLLNTFGSLAIAGMLVAGSVGVAGAAAISNGVDDSKGTYTHGNLATGESAIIGSVDDSGVSNSQITGSLTITGDVTGNEMVTEGTRVIVIPTGTVTLGDAGVANAFVYGNIDLNAGSKLVVDSTNVSVLDAGTQKGFIDFIGSVISSVEVKNNGSVTLGSVSVPLVYNAASELNITGTLTMLDGLNVSSANTDNITVNAASNLIISGDIKFVDAAAKLNITGDGKTVAQGFDATGKVINFTDGSLDLVGDNDKDTVENFLGGLNVDGGSLRLARGTALSSTDVETFGDGTGSLTFTSGTLHIGTYTKLDLASFEIVGASTGITSGSNHEVSAKSFAFGDGYSHLSATLTFAKDAAIAAGTAQGLTGTLTLGQGGVVNVADASEWGAHAANITLNHADAELNLGAGAVLNLNSFVHTDGDMTFGDAAATIETKNFTLNGTHTSGKFVLVNDDAIADPQTFAGTMFLSGVDTSITVNGGVWGDSSASLTIANAANLAFDGTNGGTLNLASFITAAGVAELNFGTSGVLNTSALSLGQATQLTAGTLGLSHAETTAKSIGHNLTLTGGKLNVAGGEWNVGSTVVITAGTAAGSVTVANGATFDVSANATGGLVATTADSVDNNGTIVINHENLGTFANATDGAVDFTLGAKFIADFLDNTGGVLQITGLATKYSGGDALGEGEYFTLLGTVKDSLTATGEEGTIELVNVVYDIESLTGVNRVHTDGANELMAGTLSFAGTTTVSHLVDNTIGTGLATTTDSLIKGNNDVDPTKNVHLVITGEGIADPTMTPLSVGSVTVNGGASLTLGDGTSGGDFDFAGLITADGDASKVIVTGDTVEMTAADVVNQTVTLTNGADLYITAGGKLIVGSFLAPTGTSLVSISGANSALQVKGGDTVAVSAFSATETPGKIFVGENGVFDVTGTLTLAGGGDLAVHTDGTIQAYGMIFDDTTATTFAAGTLALVGSDVSSDEVNDFQGKLEVSGGALNFTADAGGSVWGTSGAASNADLTVTSGTVTVGAAAANVATLNLKSLTLNGAAASTKFSIFENSIVNTPTVTMTDGTLSVGAGSILTADAFNYTAGTVTMIDGNSKIVTENFDGGATGLTLSQGVLELDTASIAKGFTGGLTVNASGTVTFTDTTAAATWGDGTAKVDLASGTFNVGNFVTVNVDDFNYTGGNLVFGNADGAIRSADFSTGLATITLTDAANTISASTSATFATGAAGTTLAKGTLNLNAANAGGTIANDLKIDAGVNLDTFATLNITGSWGKADGADLANLTVTKGYVYFGDSTIDAEKLTLGTLTLDGSNGTFTIEDTSTVDATTFTLSAGTLSMAAGSTIEADTFNYNGGSLSDVGTSSAAATIAAGTFVTDQANIELAFNESVISASTSATFKDTGTTLDTGTLVLDSTSATTTPAGFTGLLTLAGTTVAGDANLDVTGTWGSETVADRGSLTVNKGIVDVAANTTFNLDALTLGSADADFNVAAGSTVNADTFTYNLGDLTGVGSGSDGATIAAREFTAGEDTITLGSANSVISASASAAFTATGGNTLEKGIIELKTADAAGTGTFTGALTLNDADTAAENAHFNVSSGTWTTADANSDVFITDGNMTIAAALAPGATPPTTTVATFKTTGDGSNITVGANGKLTINQGGVLDVSSNNNDITGKTNGLIATAAGSVENLGTVNLHFQNLGLDRETAAADPSLPAQLEVIGSDGFIAADDSEISKYSFNNLGEIKIFGYTTGTEMTFDDFDAFVAELEADLGITGKVTLEGVVFTGLSRLDQITNQGAADQAKPYRTLQAGILEFASSAPIVIAGISVNNKDAANLKYDSIIRGAGVNLVLTGLGTPGLTPPQERNILSVGNVSVLAGATLTLGSDAGTYAGEDFAKSPSGLTFQGNITVDSDTSSLTVQHTDVTLVAADGTTMFDVELTNGADLKVIEGGTLTVKSLDFAAGTVQIGSATGTETSRLVVNDNLSIDASNIVAAPPAGTGQIAIGADDTLEVKGDITFTDKADASIGMNATGTIKAYGATFGDATDAPKISLSQGTLDLSNDPATTASQTFKGNLTVDGAGKLNFVGGDTTTTWGGTTTAEQANLTVAGTGAVTLGKLTFVNLNAFAQTGGTTTVGITTAASVNDAAALSAATLAVSGGTLTVYDYSSATGTGAFTQNGGDVNVGAGTAKATLTAGSFAVSAGTLDIEKKSTVTTAGEFKLASAGTGVVTVGSTTAASAADAATITAGSLTVEAGTLTINDYSSVTAAADTITGATGAATFSGGTITIGEAVDTSGATPVAGNGASLTATEIKVSDNAVLNINDNSTVTGTGLATFSGGTTTIGETAAGGASLTAVGINVDGGELTINDKSSAKTDSGDFTFSAGEVNVGSVNSAADADGEGASLTATAIDLSGTAELNVNAYSTVSGTTIAVKENTEVSIADGASVTGTGAATFSGGTTTVGGTAGGASFVAMGITVNGGEITINDKSTVKSGNRGSVDAIINMTGGVVNVGSKGSTATAADEGASLSATSIHLSDAAELTVNKYSTVTATYNFTINASAGDNASVTFGENSDINVGEAFAFTSQENSLEDVVLSKGTTLDAKSFTFTAMNNSLGRVVLMDGAAVTVDSFTLAENAGDQFKMQGSSKVTSKAFDLGTAAYTHSAGTFELATNGTATVDTPQLFMSDNFTLNGGTMNVDGVWAASSSTAGLTPAPAFNIQSGTVSVTSTSDFSLSAANVNFSRGTVNLTAGTDANKTTLDLSGAGLTFGDDATINTAVNTEVNMGMNIFGTLDLTAAVGQMFTEKAESEYGTITGEGTVYLTSAPKQYVSQDFLKNLGTEIIDEVKDGLATDGFTGTVSLDKAFYGFEENLTLILDPNEIITVGGKLVGVDAPTFTVGAGNYGAGFTGDVNSTFAGIHTNAAGDTDSTVSEGVLSLTGYNNDPTKQNVLSDGSITVQAGSGLSATLNLGYDGNDSTGEGGVATNGGTVKGDLTVSGDTSDVYVYGTGSDKAMGVVVEGNISIEDGGYLSVGAGWGSGDLVGKLKAENVTVGGNSAGGDNAFFGIYGETTVKSLIVEAGGVIDLDKSGVFNAESVTVESGGEFEVYVNNTAYDSASGLGIAKFTVEDGGGVYIAGGDTLSVGEASFAGSSINFTGGSSSTLFANSVTLSNANTTITNATIVTSKFEAAGAVTLGVTNGDAGNLTINSNGTSGDTKVVEWASKGDVAVANGTLNLGLGTVVDLSDHAFTAKEGATLVSVEGSNLKVGLGTVGLNADGSVDTVNAATVVAGTTDATTGVTTGGANVSSLLGTVTIMDFADSSTASGKVELDFTDGTLSTKYEDINTAGQGAFGTVANIIYDGILFKNTENLSIDQLANKSGFGESVVGYGSGFNDPNSTLHVGRISGGTSADTITGKYVTISGIDSENNSYSGVGFVGSVHGVEGVNIGNGIGETTIGVDVTTNGELILNYVGVGNDITQQKADGSAADGVAELNNVTAAGLELHNDSGSKVTGNNRFGYMTLEGNQVADFSGAGTTTVLGDGTNTGIVYISKDTDWNVTGGHTFTGTRLVLERGGRTVNFGLVTDEFGSRVSFATVDANANTILGDPAWGTTNQIENASGFAIGAFDNTTTGTDVNAKLIAGQNSFIVLGTTDLQWAEDAFNQNNGQIAWGNGAGEVSAALFIKEGQTLDETDGGILVDGMVTAATAAGTLGTTTYEIGDAVRVDATGAVTEVVSVAGDSATFAANSLLVIDASNTGVRVDTTDVALSGSSVVGSELFVVDNAADSDNNAKILIVDGKSGTLNITKGFDVLGNVSVSKNGVWDSNDVLFTSEVFDGEIFVDATTNDVTLEIYSGIELIAGYTKFQGESVKYLDNMLVTTGLDTSVDAPAGLMFLSRALTEKEGYNMGMVDERRTVQTIEGAAQMGAVANVAKGTVLANMAAAEATQARNQFLGMKSEGGNTGSVTLNNGEVTAEVGTSGGSMTEKTGLGLWLTPLYKWNMGSDFESGSFNHDSDMGLGGISLGVDFTNKIAADSALRFGLAFNLGAGYSDSTGDYNETTNDFDFWGLTAYGAFQKENFVATLDIGFTSSYNDVSQDLPTSMGMGDLSADIDSMAFSVGLNLEYTFNAGMMDITPHAGVRYMSVTTDEYEIESMYGRVATVEEDTQDIWYFPVGVTFSADIESAGGWKFTPKLDLGFIAAAGDLEATSRTRFNGVPGTLELGLENIDGFAFNGGVGFELSNPDDGISIGLNYNLQAGSKDTGHMIFANFRYDF